jgi:hypothetical protein
MKIFFKAGLDRANHVDLVQEISAAAQQLLPHPCVTAPPLRRDEVCIPKLNERRRKQRKSRPRASLSALLR